MSLLYDLPIMNPLYEAEQCGCEVGVCGTEKDCHCNCVIQEGLEPNGAGRAEIFELAFGLFQLKFPIDIQRKMLSRVG